jgi:ubiquitin C-terminal hydrolase
MLLEAIPPVNPGYTNAAGSSTLQQNGNTENGGSTGSTGEYYDNTILSTTKQSGMENTVQHTKQRRDKRPPPGFLNVGNTCYANAALQCLFSTALSRALLQPKCFPAFRSYSSNGHLLFPIEGDDDDDDDGDGEVGNGVIEQSTQFPPSGPSGPLQSSPQSKRRRTPWLQTPNQQRQKQMSELCHWITTELTIVCRAYQLQRSNGGQSTRKEVPASSSHSSFLASVFGGGSDFTPPRNVVDPSSITRHVQKLSSCLRFGQQEDSHEFLRSLISAMTMDGFNKELSSLFDGLLESSVTCQECDHSSTTRDRYMDVSLEITGPDILSLNQALEHFTRTESLSEENMVHCDQCDTKRLVKKGLRLATSPSILVCHLKRFEYDLYGRVRRINKHISFGTTLNISSYMSLANKGRPPNYDLVAMVVHQGSTCSHGHYIAYVRGGSGGQRNGSSSNTWYRVSDAIVTEVQIEDVLEKQAYILLYEATGMRHHEVDGDCGSLGGSVESSHHSITSKSKNRTINGTLSSRDTRSTTSSPPKINSEEPSTLSTFLGLFSQCGITSGTMMAGLCDAPTTHSPVRPQPEIEIEPGLGQTKDPTEEKKLSPKIKPKSIRSTRTGSYERNNRLQRRSSSCNLSCVSAPIANHSSRGRSKDAARSTKKLLSSSAGMLAPRPNQRKSRSLSQGPGTRRQMMSSSAVLTNPPPPPSTGQSSMSGVSSGRAQGWAYNGRAEARDDRSGSGSPSRHLRRRIGRRPPKPK